MKQLSAIDVRAKMSSVRTDIEMGFPEAAMNGMEELELMFVNFCKQIDSKLDDAMSVIKEMGELHG